MHGEVTFLDSNNSNKFQKEKQRRPRYAKLFLDFATLL